MNDNIYTLFESRFPQQSDCLVFADQRYTYAMLRHQVDKFARFLQSSRAVPGDRVLVQVSKSPQNLFLYLACLKSGLIYLPLNTAYLTDELAYFIADAEPALLICDPADAGDFKRLVHEAQITCDIFTLDNRNQGSLIDACQSTAVDSANPQTIERTSADTAVIIYTSGTTGQPKGAMISHGNLKSNGLTLLDAWGWTRGDVMLHTLPVFHVHGLFLGFHLPLLAGCKIILEEKFDEGRIIALLPEASVYMGVPTHYTRLLGSGKLNEATCTGMRLFTSGSAPLLPQTFKAFQEITGHTILERYGMTETGMNTSNPLIGDRKAGTVGPPLAGVEVRLLNDEGGEITDDETAHLEVRGPNVFTGYWRKPEKTSEEFTADGYFKTGDLVAMDTEGYLSIVGRSKDLIITGGLNVYPKEVESVIDRIEGVLESAVIGLPDKDFGEAVTAVVVLDSSGADLSADSIIAELKQRLANFKVAKRIHFMDHLPRNTMGKVQKNSLRQSLGGG